MSSNQRHILFGFFILTFFIITSLLIIYAAGYKLDKNNWRLEKTGILAIESEPKNATIYIDDKIQTTILKELFFSQKSQTVTPAKIKNLLPEEYDVRLEIDGYWPWQKKITIEPGQTTYLENIYLFKKNLPILISHNGITDLKISPNKKYLSATTNEQLVIIDLANETRIATNIDNLSGDNILWSPQSDQILANGSIFDVPKLKDETAIAVLADLTAADIKWNNDKLLYQKNNSIYSYNFISGKSRQIFSAEKIIDFEIRDSYLYILNEQDKKNNLEIYRTEGMQLLRTVILPYLSDYKFIDFQNGLISLLDKNHEIIYLINPTSARISPVEEIISQATQAQWINNNQLLYANDFEIWLYDADSRRQDLITRISEKINFIAWHPSNNHVIYTTNNALYVIELNNAETKKLLSIDHILMPQLDQKSKVIYFSAKIGKQEGLYKLYIH